MMFRNFFIAFLFLHVALCVDIRKQCEHLQDPSLISPCKTAADAYKLYEKIFHENPFGIVRAIVKSSSIKKEERQRCPSGQEVLNSTETNIRTFSPWVYKINYDPLRIPSVIQFAQCSCEGCIDPTTGRENKDLVSRLLTIDYPVLKVIDRTVSYQECKDLIGCVYDFITVGVACFCSFAST